MPKSTLRRGSSALLAVCFVLLATHLSAAASPEPNQPLLLQPEVQSLLAQAQRGGELRVIVRLNIPGYLQGPTRNALTAALQAEAVQTAQDRLAREIGGPNARIQRAFRRFPLAVLEVNAAGLQRLIESPLVSAIQEDVPVPPTLDDTVPHIGADAAWAAGYSGAGQVVAILDTGVDTAHEFLAGKVVAEACFSSTFTGTSSSVCPDGTDEQIGAGAGMNCPDAVSGCYHGTHVAGIAAGSLPASSLYGVARDADLIAIQVFSRFDDEAYCGVGNAPCALSWTSDQIAALEWLHDQTSSYSIAAANMSLGGGENFAPCDSDSRKLPIDQLRADGVATVIASANDGYTAAIGAPACISTAISVGSTTLADEVSFFSNVASFLSLLAPGSSVYSSMPGDSYTWLSGTSMAAPHVSGAWAVIKSYQPLASVDSVLDSLQSTGVSVDDSRSGGTVTDMRRIQVDAAILAIPTVTPTATDTPVASNTPSATPETPTATATPTDTPVPPTNTPTSTATPVPPTDTATPTATFTPTSTPTPTPTSTFTATPTPTDTPTPTATFTPTPTPTNTPVPPTATATATDTPVPPTATPTLTSSPTPSATPDETGDLNLDGVVNVLDVQLAINVFLGTETDPGIAALADVNDDGSVDVLDVQLIIVIYLAS